MKAFPYGYVEEGELAPAEPSARSESRFNSTICFFIVVHIHWQPVTCVSDLITSQWPRPLQTAPSKGPSLLCVLQQTRLRLYHNKPGATQRPVPHTRAHAAGVGRRNEGQIHPRLHPTHIQPAFLTLHAHLLCCILQTAAAFSQPFVDAITPDRRRGNAPGVVCKIP